MQFSNLPLNVPNFKESLEKVTLYDLPVASKKIGTPLLPAPGQPENFVEVIESPAVAFRYAGNWYIALKENGQVPTNPEAWSLLGDSTADLGRFYHMRNYSDKASSEASRDLFAEVHFAVSHLSMKEIAQTLPVSTAKLSTQQISDIILSKERQGGGVLDAEENNYRQITQMYGHDTRIFKLTKEEIELANEDPERRNHEMRVGNESLALYAAAGKAFLPVRLGISGGHNIMYGRVFYAPNTDNPPTVRRLIVDFDEYMMPGGLRAHKPRIRQTVLPLQDVLKQFGGVSDISHAPDAISEFMKTGDKKAFEDYVENVLVPEYVRAEEYARYRSGTFLEQALGETPPFDPANPVYKPLGEEMGIKKFLGPNHSAFSWTRVVRNSDYVPQTKSGSGEAGSTALATDSIRVFDPNRADYFAIGWHPDKNACHHEQVNLYHSAGKEFDYVGPNYELFFSKGDPEGKNPPEVEMISLKCRQLGTPEADAEIAKELRKRGVTADAKLLNIGRDEEAELWRSSSRNLVKNAYRKGIVKPEYLVEKIADERTLKDDAEGQGHVARIKDRAQGDKKERF